MARAEQTIAELIEELARETEAPASFVDQVSTLFAQKGIPLDTDGSPYADAIRQTFLSDAQLRASTARARAHLGELKDRMQRLGEAWERQLGEVSRIKASLEQRLLEARRHAMWVRARGAAVVETAPRPFIVPGPKDLQ
jgi:hypothetical protein